MNCENLNLFKKSHQLVLNIYELTKFFPEEEKFRLINQIIRCAYSIPANICEGNSRNTTKEYINFLYISRGSLNELKYFLLLARDLKYINEIQFQNVNKQCNETGKMLNGLINSLKTKTLNPKS
ncbi:MAG: four helix bundle protein [Candidatus Cloacimonetes bacterium]|nr:four helix bundle protein [Candidatus Cloacimonadota bacterium]